MLNKLAAVPAQTVEAVTAHVLATLATNGKDVPLAMLYQRRVDKEPATLQLQGQNGLPEGHQLLVDVAEICGAEGLIPDLRHAGSESLFIDRDERFDSVSWQGWGAPSKKIAILPITSLDGVFGYPAIGSNPYRPFDDAYRQFTRDLSRMVSAIFTAAVNFELAEKSREQLKSDLAFSNPQRRHLVEHASVGMCYVSVDGELLWANEHYFHLAGRSVDEYAAKYSFYDVHLIFIDLLTNAIKFVKSTKINPSIQIKYGACLSDPRSWFPNRMVWADSKSTIDMSDPKWGKGGQLFLTFTIQGCGIGLDSDAIAKVFERFTQANIKTHVTYGGSGLELYISKELAEKQGGEIGVSSVSGQGATFGFYVKARRREIEHAMLTSPTSGLESLKPKTQQLHVLLVEDNMINQQVLSKQLRRAGCVIHVANHGLEALQILEEETLDAVLMDCEMPVLDGLSATRMIRQEELRGEGFLGTALATKTRAGKQLTIIAVTANVPRRTNQSSN